MNNNLFGVIHGKNMKQITLKNIDIEANIVDMLAEVKITQTFKNETPETLQTEYTFPLISSVAIYKFEVEVDGGKTINGIIKESYEANQEFNEAVKQNNNNSDKRASNNKSDLFQFSIGNLKPFQTTVIKITYLTELKNDADIEQVRFILPATFRTPRHKLSKGSFFHKNNNNSECPISIIITCKTTSVINKIESPSHFISTEWNIDGNSKIARITLTKDVQLLDRDFVLIIKSKDLDQPRAFLEYNEKTSSNCIMLTFVPTFSMTTVRSELVFIVNTSSSMRRDALKFRKTIQSLEFLLYSLPQDCYFNIISVEDNHYNTLSDKSHQKSKTIFSKALGFIKNFELEYNYEECEACETVDIYEPLKWAIENSLSDMPSTLFLLTDNNVENRDVNIGDFVGCENLIETLTNVGRGYTQFLATNERIEKKLRGMLRNAVTHPITDCRLIWTAANGEQDVIEEIPALFSGNRFTFYCIEENEASVNDTLLLTANSLEGIIELKFVIENIVLEGNKIHALAAKKLIQSFQDGNSYIHNQNNGYMSEEQIEEEIGSLSNLYNIATSRTRMKLMVP
ncbi:15869_t:CDS:2 [Funneliformis mosseae]|uniref:15869_t:CDS:1 n=1 Tax=Funneliformis mosseae TaxID=27381 RepID=A0A9N9E4B1_FUNMO|nr:15869_t:CDS:2 [Funneliformis mosseae]